MQLGADLTYAWRRLVKMPLLTLMMVVMLALGISAATAAFSMLDTIILQPLPVPDQGRLLAIYTSGEGPRGSAYGNSSYPDYVDLRDSGSGLSGMAVYTDTFANVSAESFAERVPVQIVSANYFDVVGVPAAAGRTFDRADAIGDPVVVVSDELRQRLAPGADSRAVVGRAIKINGRFFTVAGVAPADFRGLRLSSSPDLWIPIEFLGQIAPEDVPRLKRRNSRGLDIVGRLDDGTSREQAESRLHAVFAGLVQQYPETNRDRRLTVVPAREGAIPPVLVRGVLNLMRIFLAVAVVFLLTVCANVGNILLVQGLSRTRDMAVQLCLGGSYRRLVRQLITESVLLTGLSGVVAIAPTYWFIQLLSTLDLPAPASFTLEFGVTWRVFLFMVVLAVSMGALLAIAPALRLRRFDLVSQLKSGEGKGARSTVLWKGFVAAQIAASTALLVLAALLVQSFRRADSVEPGFAISDRMVFALDLRTQRYNEEQRLSFHRRLFDELRAVPGVMSAAVMLSPPLSTGGRRGAVFPVGQEVAGSEGPGAELNVVSPDYFRTLGIPLVAGRAFEERDVAGQPRVAVVNQALADLLWPGKNPIGQQLRFDKEDAPVAEVVGVVADAKYRTLREPQRTVLYHALFQEPEQRVSVVVHHESRASTLGVRLGEAVHRINADLPLIQVRTLQAQFDQSLASERTAAFAASAVGIAGFVVGLIGLYGMMAFSVSQRRREFGIRMSLGATPHEPVRLMVRSSLALSAVGIVAGAFGAWGLGRLMGTFLFQTTTTEIPAYVGVALMLGGAALAASYWAARGVGVAPASDLLRYE
jgi:predicted permease